MTLPTRHGQRRVDGYLAQGKVAGCFIDQDRGEFANDLAELLAFRVFASQQSQLVQYKRMQGRKYVGSHGSSDGVE